MNKVTGGPAFPAQWVNDGDQNNSAPDGAVCPPGWTHHMQGMTLRDYFAAKALPGIIVSAEVGSDAEAVKKDAQKAYEYADAMLAERAK